MTTESVTAAVTSTPSANPTIRVDGLASVKLPTDLYIPPDALEIFLETFEGPLDLLLYLIKRQQIDILNIPIAEITRQYMDYLAAMQELKLELAAEYLVMAAVLAEIKSRLLLPKPQSTDSPDDVDPRADLVQRLQTYERFKKAAEDLNALPRLERDLFIATAALIQREVRRIPPPVHLEELVTALRDVLQRADLHGAHHIQREALSVRERMSHLLERLDAIHFIAFTSLFTPQEGRLGIVVTFLAILELSREALVEWVQSEPFAPLYVRLVALPSPDL